MNTQKKYVIPWVIAIIIIILIGILAYWHFTSVNNPPYGGNPSSQNTAASSTATSTASSSSSTTPGFAIVTVNGMSGYSNFGFSFNYPATLKLSQATSPIEEVTGGFVASSAGITDTSSGQPSNAANISSISVVKTSGVTAAACVAAPVGNDWVNNLGKVTINGNVFNKYSYGSNSGSRYFRTDLYASEIGGNCYKVSLSNVGTLPQTAAETASINASLPVLNTIITSFKAR